MVGHVGRQLVFSFSSLREEKCLAALGGFEGEEKGGNTRWWQQRYTVGFVLSYIKDLLGAEMSECSGAFFHTIMSVSLNGSSSNQLT